MQISIPDFPIPISPTSIVTPPKPPLPPQFAPNTDTPTVLRMEVDDADHIYDYTVKCFA